jgi:opacity protein-like surface antigen
MYVAGFGGYTFGHNFNDIEGSGTIADTPLGEVDLKNSAIYGGKVGYFLPDRWNWLGLEAEAFNTTPHLKQSPNTLGPGNHLRVTTLAFNAIARGKWGCTRRDRDREVSRRTADVRTDAYRDEPWCPLQPYVGVGLGIFFARTNGALGTSSDNAVPGLNALAGVRYFFSEKVAAFAEYKYTRASFDFDSLGAGAGMRGDYSASHIVGGLSLHF